MFFDLHRYPHFAYDTETNGLQYPTSHVFGFSISTPDGKNHYWDIRETPQAVEWFNDEIQGYKGTIIAHNASFDYRMSYSTRIYMPIDCLDDTVIRACQINEHLMSYDLDSLGKKYVGMQKEGNIYRELADIFGGRATRNCQIGNLYRAPSSLVAPYAKRDTEVTLALWEWQEKEIGEQDIEDICRFERDKMPTFIRAEMRGIRVDLDYAEEAADAYTPIINAQRKELNKIAGFEVNVDSPPQIKRIFEPEYQEGRGWFANDGTLIGTTPKGNASLGAEFLRKMSSPAAKLILELRSDIKTRDTFLRGHVLQHAINGRVYPTINQSKGEDGGTGTGRLSYSNPAMQQIPSRNKQKAAIVKPCFLPDEGQTWVDTDESSFEVRVFAHLVNNPEIIAAYQANPELDLHQFVADLTNLIRNATYSGQPNAKQLNLSMIFNSGNGAIADKMGMDWEWQSFTARDGKVITYKKAGPEAEAIIAKYHRRIPGVKKLAEGCKRVAENRGYIHTYTGRRLRFPHGYKSYKASGLLIQATSADLNKENWKLIEDVLGDDGHLILNTHDSYSMSLPEDWQPYYKKVKKALDRDALRVPLLLDLSGAGKNWWAALNGD